MGSMLAYKERELKKRLAYSTVSQVSYVLYLLTKPLVGGIPTKVIETKVKHQRVIGICFPIPFN